MKKSIIALFLALSFMAGSDAFASRARLLVNGTGDAGMILDGAGGSFYTEDAYNMFYNPSYVNDYKDWGIIERSQAGAAADNPFGGFVTSMMNTNVGVFFNRNTYLPTFTTAATRAAMRPIELLVGGDHGVKWGLGLSYARASTVLGISSDIMFRLGAQFEGLDPFINYKIQGNEKGTTGGDNFNNKFKDMTIGTRYHWGEWVPYAAWRNRKAAGNVSSNSFGLGLGRNTKVAEGVKLNYGFGFWRTGKTTGQTVVPVDMSVEGDATSWLTLRAGLNYRLYDQMAKTTAADASTGRLGATFKWNKLSMDWAVGTGTTGGAAGGAEALDNSTFGFDAGLFAATSLQYSW